MARADLLSIFMSLAAGFRLGQYEIHSPLGADGMGEVFRAVIRRLKRDVALKGLPEAFTQDPDRLATLNHPNIAAVYGLEKSDAVTGIVMELVDGETPAERMAGRSEDRPLRGTDSRSGRASEVGPVVTSLKTSRPGLTSAC